MLLGQPGLILLQISSGGVWQSRDLQLSRSTLYLLSPRLCFFKLVNHDLLVNPDDLLTSSKAVVLLWFSFICFGVSVGDVSPYVCAYYFQFG